MVKKKGTLEKTNQTNILKRNKGIFNNKYLQILILLPNMKTQILILFFCMASLACCTSFPFTVTCQFCTANCPHIYCYKVQTDDWSYQFCGYMNCLPTLQIKAIATKCQKSQSCRSGVCITDATMNLCLPKEVPLQKCSLNFSQTIYCDKCQKKTNCQSGICQMYNSTLVPSKTQTCMTNCTKYVPTTYYIKPCSQITDNVLNNCTCCYYAPSYASLFGTCLNKNNYFKAYYFTLYAESKFAQLESNSANTTANSTSNTTNSTKTNIKSKWQNILCVFMLTILINMMML